jgi:hypothetical protein
LGPIPGRDVLCTVVGERKGRIGIDILMISLTSWVMFGHCSAQCEYFVRNHRVSRPLRALQGHSASLIVASLTVVTPASPLQRPCSRALSANRTQGNIVVGSRRTSHGLPIPLLTTNEMLLAIPGAFSVRLNQASQHPERLLSQTAYNLPQGFLSISVDIRTPPFLLFGHPVFTV